MSLQIKKVFGNLPISLKMLAGLLSVCLVLTAASGIVHYRQSRETLVDSIRSQAGALCEHLERRFEMCYAAPIEHELRILAASPQLDSYLMSSKGEMLIHRADIEMLFLSMSQERDIHLSTTFLDALGREKIGVAGRVRKRTFRSLTEIARDGLLGSSTHELFAELKAGRTATGGYRGPFRDARNRMSILAGIAKQDPEAGGFGGAVIQHCDLTGFMDEVSQSRILDTAVMWAYGSDGENLLSPPGGEVRQDPERYLAPEKVPANVYLYTAECKLFGREKPVMTIVCSVPREVVSRQLVPILWSVIIVFSILLAGSLVSSLLISRWISRPIRNLTQALRNVSGRSLDIDLDARLTESEDEMGVLAQAFRKMIQDLKASTTSIDHLQRAEQEQARLLKQLGEINQELTEFAYVVSHDLKAPLRAIRTIVDWLNADYADKFDEQGREYLTVLANRTVRMHNLIDGVLQYSRIGRTEQSVEPVDLGRLVPEIIDSLGAPEHISIAIETDLPTIEANPTRIMQVFQNFLSNAIKYMDKTQGRIAVACVEEDAFWQFSVADNGPGIEQRHFDRIFKLFQTLSPRDEQESTGVGLALVKKIVELYGGRIWVESEVGRGSTFFFTLPKHDERITREKYQACAAGRR